MLLLPVYASVRFGRVVWGLPSVRRHVLPGVVLSTLYALYAVPLVGSGATSEQDGQLLGRAVLDSALVESLRTLAVACVLAGTLAMVDVIAAPSERRSLQCRR